MDIAMPIMDGKEASKKILKSVAESINIKVIKRNLTVIEEEKTPKKKNTPQSFPQDVDNNDNNDQEELDK